MANGKIETWDEFTEAVGKLPPGPRHPDTVRLDWLEKEAERELTCTATVTPCVSIFRRNAPITRAAIDEAMAAWSEAPTQITSQEKS